jgi:UDP-N-acetylglucosamine/UDP-N-acetylgalactosamine 4-epimerase
MYQISQYCADRLKEPKRWVVTGAAGFIGSHLAEQLLRHGQEVVGYDNFATGQRKNLRLIEEAVGSDAFKRFRMVEATILDKDALDDAMKDANYVLHQAALGSVPRSLENPMASHQANDTGTVNVLLAARDAGVKRVVMASSSAVYGDHPDLPKVEEKIGNPLSPYAATKRTCEIYSRVFANNFGLESICLRYFNVFGPRQDPSGAYAAVIPKWIDALLSGESVKINGDGTTSRDFCYIANVVEANLLAATIDRFEPNNHIFNIAAGGRTTLNELLGYLRQLIAEEKGIAIGDVPDAKYGPFRAGDVMHSHANIDKARGVFGYDPAYSVMDGLRESMAWYAAAAGK